MIGVAKIGVAARRGGGGAPSVNPDFVIQVDTTQSGVTASDSIRLPLQIYGTYSGTIDWGDGNSDPLAYANYEHTYASGGTTVLDLDFLASDSHSVNIPDDGIRCSSDVYVSAATNITAITFFYS